MTLGAEALLGIHCTDPVAVRGDDDTSQVGRRRQGTPVRTVPMVAVLLVILEFVALFAATWIAWFAVVTLYQIVTRRSKKRTT